MFPAPSSLASSGPRLKDATLASALRTACDPDVDEAVRVAALVDLRGTEIGERFAAGRSVVPLLNEPLPWLASEAAATLAVIGTAVAVGVNAHGLLAASPSTFSGLEYSSGWLQCPSLGRVAVATELPRLLPYVAGELALFASHPAVIVAFDRGQRIAHLGNKLRSGRDGAGIIPDWGAWDLEVDGAGLYVTGHEPRGHLDSTVPRRPLAIREPLEGKWNRNVFVDAFLPARRADERVRVILPFVRPEHRVVELAVAEQLAAASLVFTCIDRDKVGVRDPAARACRVLVAGETVTIDGVDLRMASGELSVGT